MGDGYEPSGCPKEARIRELQAENARLREALETIAAEPATRCNGYSRCTDMFVGAHVPLTARAALLPARGA